MNMIKFRAWDTQEEVMIDDWIYEFLSLEGHDCGIPFSGDDRRIVLQFLGGLDKYAVELFEGDIIKHWSYACDLNKNEEAEILLIDSLEGFFKHVGYCESELGEEWGSNSFEIIGNKFEDSELIPKDKNNIL